MGHCVASVTKFQSQLAQKPKLFTTRRKIRPYPRSEECILPVKQSLPHAARYSARTSHIASVEMIGVSTRASAPCTP